MALVRRAVAARHPRPAASALLVTALLVWALADACADGTQRSAEAHELKAAFLFNFARYVKWPDDSGTLAMCVLGQDAVSSVLDAFEGQVVQNRALQVRRISDASPLDGCQVLYVSRSEDSRLAWTMPALRASRGVLTVSDVEGFTDAGGMIEFVAAGRRVRFDVNLAAAREAGVQISSKVLRLARRVRDGTQ